MSTRVVAFREKPSDKKSTRYNRLKDYRWGFGLEHELHVFHLPYPKRNEYIKDFIVYDSWDAVINILENPLSSKYGLTALQKHFLSNIPFETSGRLCHGKWVIKKIEFKMPEIITDHPFSSLKEGKRSIESYCHQLMDREAEFLNLLYDFDRLNQSKIKKYGALMYYPTGYSSYIQEPRSYLGGKYKFKPTLTKDYLGSFHLTVTLPYNHKTSEKEFINIHKNFANQLQWLEPLLLSAFFSSDDTAMGTTQKDVRGSFRVMRIGWGNFAGSDVRKFDKGIGRYSNIKTFWREGLEFYGLNKLKYCSTPTIQEPGAISALSSNFRTFGAPDPNKPDERKSGAPMTIPNGVEFRIFDHFPTIYLEEMCKLVMMVAENSRKHHTKQYVYKNKAWKMTMHTIMKNGWKAHVPESYIDELRTMLGLKIATTNFQAYHVLEVVNNELFQKNKGGDWAYLLLDEASRKSAAVLPKINQHSWELGFLIKMNRNKNILNSWNLILRSIKNYKSFTREEFEVMFYQAFNKKNWEHNIDDIIYFLETREYLKLHTDSHGYITSFTVIQNNITEWTNKEVNSYILNEWTRTTKKYIDLSHLE